MPRRIAIMQAHTERFGLSTSEEARRSVTIEAVSHEQPPRSIGAGPCAGDAIAPDLRLVMPLGEGGMGCVWIAEHDKLDRPVAVKLLRSHIAHEPSARERLRREAVAASKLRSPYIVEVLDFGDTEQAVPFIAMELLEGETLQDRVEVGGPLPFAQTLPIIRHTCAGLAAAHAAGIVHRDIKPDNIFLVSGERPVAKILDFGIARQLDERVSRMTTTGNVVGTPLFMAPEQMSGVAVLPASDVWSLAVVIYFSLTGRLPYDGPNLAALALAIDRERPIPVSRYVDSLPRNFDAWLGRALAPRHEDRYSDTSEMLVAFERYVAPDDAGPMPRAHGGAAWDVRGPLAQQQVRGRFPVAKRALELDSRPSSLPTTSRSARIQRHGVGRGVLCAAAGALVGSLGLVWIYAGDAAEATPSRSRAGVDVQRIEGARTPTEKRSKEDLLASPQRGQRPLANIIGANTGEGAESSGNAPMDAPMAALMPSTEPPPGSAVSSKLASTSKARERKTHRAPTQPARRTRWNHRRNLGF